jgi:hypothetical protein
MAFQDWAQAVGGIQTFDRIAKKVGIPTDDVFRVLAQMTVDDKIRFASSPDNEAAVFLASRPKDDLWPEQENRIADALLSMFVRGGDFSTKTGEVTQLIVASIPVREWIKISQKDIGKLAEAANLSRRVVEEILIRFDERDWITVQWNEAKRSHRVHVKVKDASGMTPAERRVVLTMTSGVWELDSNHNHLSERFAAHETYGTPPHMRAIESQRATLANLEHTLQREEAGQIDCGGYSAETLWRTDVEILREADTYCWHPDPQHAAIAASRSLPASVRLTEDLTHGKSGWWYFVEPMPWKTTEGTETTPALLWSWAYGKGVDVPMKSWIGKNGPGVVFSIYVPMGNGDHLSPSTMFFWKDGETLEATLIRIRSEWMSRSNRKDNGIYESFGVDQTMTLIESVIRFFAAGCLWMEQKILRTTDTPIERHARKRMERESFRRSLNAVRVVELRRTQSTVMRDEEPGSGRVVHWSCQWLVDGHWRKNGRYASKPKYIHAYTKGPDTMPFRPKAEKVYSVKR